MKIPAQLLVSSKTSHLIFSDATPSQIKSKGKDFNRGELHVVDNIIQELTLKHMSGASGRGSTTVWAEIGCVIGREPNQVEKTLSITSDELLKLMSGTTVKGMVFGGQYVAVFNGLSFTLEPYTPELFNKEEELQDKKERERLDKLQQRKQIREANQDVLSQATRGDILDIRGKEVVYVGYGYFTYLNNTQGGVASYISQKSHIVLIGGNHNRLKVARVDISGVEIKPTYGSYPIDQVLEENREFIKSCSRGASYLSWVESHQRVQKLTMALTLEATLSSYSQSKEGSLRAYKEAQESIRYGNGKVPSEYWDKLRGIDILKEGSLFFKGVNEIDLR